MSVERDPTTDQPLPKVTPKSVPVLARIKDLLNERTALGIKKYGVPVLTNTGRVADRDALEEAIDLIQYQQQRVMERDDTIATLTAENERLKHEAERRGGQLQLLIDDCKKTEAERDQARNAILAFGNGNDFDWKVLAKIDSQQAVITLQGQTIDQLRKELAEAKAVVDAARDKCEKILRNQPCHGEGGTMFYPVLDPDGEYVGETYIDPIGYAGGIIEEVEGIFDTLAQHESKEAGGT